MGHGLFSQYSCTGRTMLVFLISGNSLRIDILEQLILTIFISFLSAMSVVGMTFPILSSNQ